MKSRIMKILKKTGAGLLAVAMVVVGSNATSMVAHAATSEGIENKVTYQKVKYSDCKGYIAEQKAPEYETVSGVDDSYGYLFAGWFTKEEDASENKITASTTGIEDETIVYAKFVPAYVMSVKCQNLSTTTKDSTSTSIRLLSSLDSSMYSEFGFHVEKLTKNEDGSYTVATEAEKAVSKIYAGGIDIYSSSTVKDTYSTSNVFGQESEYAAMMILKNVTDFTAVYSVQPYWKTFDGTKVYGLARNVHVEDGLNGYINVPVNLKSEDGVAAGVLTVNCSALPTGYELFDVERGVAFQEMEYNATDNVITIVCNVADIAANVASDDLFANLRFKPTDGNAASRSYDGTFYHFEISEIDFCDISETELDDYTVWNIQY